MSPLSCNFLNGRQVGEMEEVKLDIQIRSEIGSQRVKSVRREQGMIPGVVYGEGKEPTIVKVNRRAFEKIRREHHGEVVFHLNVMEGEKKLRDYSAVVKEEQRDCVTGVPIHVDFQRISLTDSIEVKVPVAAKGTPVGVKKGGGSLEHILWELDIVCLPMNIPEEILVDVSALEVGQVIHVRDIILPAGVVTHHEPETIVFSVVAQRGEAEEESAEGSAEPEVIKKEKAAGTDGKPEEGGKTKE